VREYPHKIWPTIYTNIGSLYFRVVKFPLNIGGAGWDGIKKMRIEPPMETQVGKW